MCQVSTPCTYVHTHTHTHTHTGREGEGVHIQGICVLHISMPTVYTAAVWRLSYLSESEITWTISQQTLINHTLHSVPIHYTDNIHILYVCMEH